MRRLENRVSQWVRIQSYCVQTCVQTCVQDIEMEMLSWLDGSFYGDSVALGCPRRRSAVVSGIGCRLIILYIHTYICLVYLCSIY